MVKTIDQKATHTYNCIHGHDLVPLYSSKQETKNTHLSPRQPFPTSIGTMFKNLVTLSLDMNLHNKEKSKFMTDDIMVSK